MSSAMSSLFTTPTYEIIAGSSGQQFFAHAGILSKSATLRKVVEGDWKESAERRIDSKEWDEETVTFLLDWLYTGTYNILSKTRSETVTAKRSHDEGNSDFETQKDDCARKPFGTPPHSRPDNPWAIPVVTDDITPEPTMVRSVTPIESIFCPERSYGEDANQRSSDIHELEKLEIGGDKNDDYEGALPRYTISGSTFLSHAKIYALANYLDLLDLKCLAFRNIKNAMKQISEIMPESLLVNHTVELIHYVYANTDYLINSEEPLRKLVSTFVSQWFTGFHGVSVNKLMADSGDFVVDLQQKLRRNTQWFQAKHIMEKAAFEKVKDAAEQSIRLQADLRKQMEDERQLHAREKKAWEKQFRASRQLANIQPNPQLLNLSSRPERA